MKKIRETISLFDQVINAFDIKTLHMMRIEMSRIRLSGPAARKIMTELGIKAEINFEIEVNDNRSLIVRTPSVSIYYTGSDLKDFLRKPRIAYAGEGYIAVGSKVLDMLSTISRSNADNI